MEKTFVLLALVALPWFLGLTGCSTEGGLPSGTSWDDVVDVDWRLQSISGVPTIEGRDVTIRFAKDGSASGSGGANSWFASFVRDGEQVSLGPVGATKMFLDDPPGLMDQEQEYFAALNSVATWSIVGGQLGLAQTDGGSLVFERM